MKRHYPKEFINTYNYTALGTDTIHGLNRLDQRMEKAHDLCKSGLISITEALNMIRG